LGENEISGVNVKWLHMSVVSHIIIVSIDKKLKVLTKEKEAEALFFYERSLNALPKSQHHDMIPDERLTR